MNIQYYRVIIAIVGFISLNGCVGYAGQPYGHYSSQVVSPYGYSRSMPGGYNNYGSYPMQQPYYQGGGMGYGNYGGYREHEEHEEHEAREHGWGGGRRW